MSLSLPYPYHFISGTKMYDFFFWLENDKHFHFDHLIMIFIITELFCSRIDALPHIQIFVEIWFEVWMYCENLWNFVSLFGCRRFSWVPENTLWNQVMSLWHNRVMSLWHGYIQVSAMSNPYLAKVIIKCRVCIYVMPISYLVAFVTTGLHSYHLFDGTLTSIVVIITHSGFHTYLMVCY